MNRIKKIIITGIFIGCLQTFFMPNAIFAESYLTVDTGYRYDNINEKIRALVPPSALFNFNSNQFKDIQSYTLGVKGIWDSIFCFCPSVLVKGSAHYSWVIDGAFNQFSLFKDDLSGHSWDASLAIGYPICLCPYLSFVPLLGGSYDRIKLTIHNVRAFDGGIVVPNDFEGAKWTTSWYGPWAGFDVVFKQRCGCVSLIFNAGYEFHYGWTNARWDFRRNDPATLNFSYSVLAKYMTGNVFHFDVIYPFFCNWVAGLSLKYTSWSNNATQKDKIPPPVETGYPAGTIQQTEWLSWVSFSATFNVGLSF